MAGAGTKSGAAGVRWTARRASLLSAAALNVLADTARAQSAKEAQDAAQAAIRRLDLQTELPHGSEPASSWHFNLPPETLWVVIAIAVAILLYAFRDLIPVLGMRGSAWSEDEPAPDSAQAGAQMMQLGAADRLAAEGRFAEAMHVLLLDGLAHMRQRLAEQFSDSLTSREILRRTNLPAEARTALRDVVTRVELTYFGEYPAAAADYNACRASFNALARSLYGTAA
jgi:hypothetical protein